MREISDAHYSSLIIDSNPDVWNTDQLTSARYSSLNDSYANERLLKLWPGVCHKRESLKKATLSLLDELTLDIKLCHVQSYNNASDTSGGLQSRIKSKNQLAE